LLQPFGIEFDDKREGAKPSLGVRTARDGNDCKLANVYEDGAAHRAGLSAGDVLAAIDGLRVNAGNLDALLGRYRNGDTIALHAFRRDELMTFAVRMKADDAPQITLTACDKPAAALRLRKTWLTK
jgi:predicted metalloprotease with PDZ domain